MVYAVLFGKKWILSNYHVKHKRFTVKTVKALAATVSLYF